MTGSSLGQTRKGMREIDVEGQAREENSQKDQLGEMKWNIFSIWRNEEKERGIGVKIFRDWLKCRSIMVDEELVIRILYIHER